MAGEPDVRVRLTPEGLSEVLAAFRKIQSEAVATKQKLATPAPGGSTGFLGGLKKGVGEFGTALAGVGKLLGPLGIAVSAGAAVVQLKNLVVQASETAEATQNLALSADVSIEGLQALQLVAGDNAVSQEQLHGAIARTGQGLADLRDGVPEATKRFAELKLTVADFDGKDVAEALGIVAKAITTLPGDQKLRALKEFFGDKKGLLGAFVDEIGTSSIDEVIEKYKKLGLILDGDVVKSAALVGNQFAKLEAQANAMATTFIAAAGPGIVEALNEILEVVAENKGTIADLGRIFSNVVRPATTGVLIIVRAIAFELQLAVEQAIALGQALRAAAKGDQKGLFEAEDRILRALDPRRRIEFAKGQVDLLRTLAKQILEPAAPLNLPAGGDAAGGAADKARIARAAFLEQQALQKANAETELAELRARNRLETQEQQNKFESGLTSIRQYYAQQRAVITTETAKEIQILQQRIALEKKDSTLSDSERSISESKLKSQITVAQLDARQKLSQLDEKERLEQRKLAEQIHRTVLESSLDEEQRHQARMADIAAEGAAFEQALRQANNTPEGVPDPAAERGRINLTDTRTRQLEFSEATEQARAKLSDLAAIRADIQADVNAGLLSQVQGDAQILDLEKARLPRLQEIAAKMLDIASRVKDVQLRGDLTAQALDFADAIRGVSRSVASAHLSLEKLKAVGVDALHAGIVDGLTAEIHTWNDLGEAALAAADQVVSAIQRIAAEELATGITDALFHRKKAASNPEEILSFLSSFFSFGFAKGGKVEKKAEGGPIRGPGTGTSDSIPARLSDGEFVEPAATVRVPGVLQHLEALRQVRSVSDFRRTIASVFTGGGEAAGTKYSGGFTITEEGRRVANDPAAYARSLVEPARETRGRRDRTRGVSKGAVARFADGGRVLGPGTGASDSIPAWLSAGEYVQPAATVRVPGVLPHLEALRSVRSESDFRRTIATTYTRADLESAIRGMSARVPTSSSFIPRFAEGGLVSASSFREAPSGQSAPSSASPRLNGRVDVNVTVAEGLAAKVLGSSQFEDNVMRVFAKNPRAMRRHMGL